MFSVFLFLCRTLGCDPNRRNISFGKSTLENPSTFREVESVAAKSSYVSGDAG